MAQILNKVSIVGFASCYGAQDMRCANGPLILKELHLQQLLEKQNLAVQWMKNIYPEYAPNNKEANTRLVYDVCHDLAEQLQKIIGNNEQFVVVGGDHSCAIGTWSGVFAGLRKNQDFGLIWIDAHMDSHTPDSSPSGAIHGMPLASLMGYGDEAFSSLIAPEKKLKPENLCLVGIRSFEQKEAELLQNSGVKIFYMADVEKLGLQTVLQMAQDHVCQSTSHYGISIDLDAIDPMQAPGVGSPEKHGLSGEELITCLKKLDKSKNFLGIEIAELNSDKDRDDITAKLAIEIIQACFHKD